MALKRGTQALAASRRKTSSVKTKSNKASPVKAAAKAANQGVLSTGERNQLIETALDLLEKLYVHLPLKRSMYAVNPLQRLKLLRRRTGFQPQIEEREFLNELLSIFAELRDLHTNFVLPEPFRSSTAFLPFRLERCADESGGDIYVVSEVMADQISDSHFRRGCVVTHWNGTPIHRVVATNADREAGSNPAARMAQGLAALTIRWLGQSLLPDEDWVDVSYQPLDSQETHVKRFEWNVFQRQAAGAEASAIARAIGDRASAVGMDARGESERLVRGHLFGESRKQLPRVKHFGDQEQSIAPWAKEVFPVCGNVKTKAGVFAYVKVATFNVEEDEKYLQEFIRILSQLSQDGLILDVRGNGGGLIYFGERMLQLLTPGPIDPARFSFLNSVRTQKLTENHAFIKQWNDSIAQWVETGSEYSQGYPLLPLPRYNDIGQKYQGPVVLVTNALCYSTTDIFAAGFQDHKIGVVLGVDENTGAGGANVWDYSLIAQLLGDPNFPLALPRSASFRFAVRRVTRVAQNTGVLLEDLGVKPDEMHRLTRRDILERSVDLIEHAAKILKSRRVQRLSVESLSKTELQISHQNLSRIDIYLGGRPLQSLDVEAADKLKKRRLEIPRPRPGAMQRDIRLEGFRPNGQGLDELVAATRLKF